MKHFIVGTVATAIAFFILVKLIPGYVEYSGELTGLLVLAVIFGVVNGLIKPIIKLLALPVRLMTLGLIGFVINGAMLLLTAWLASLLKIDFTVGGWPAGAFGLDVIVAAIVGAIVLTVILAISDRVVPD